MTTQRITDALFVIQVGCALLFGITQTARMLTTTEGVSLTWFLFWALFLFINLRLAVRAHQVYPTRLSRQTIVTYVAWSSVLAVAIVVLVWRSLGQWEPVDTLNVLVSGLGIGLVLGVGRLRGLASPIRWFAGGSRCSSRARHSSRWPGTFCKTAVRDLHRLPFSPGISPSIFVSASSSSRCEKRVGIGTG